jgi:dihydroorotate dehydrogenase (fumarate)
MDLRTTYLGLELQHPIVPSASPLSENLDTICRLEDAGAPAIVMHSLFEEQLTAESQQLDHYLSYFTDSYAEALSYFPEGQSYNVGPDEYLDKIRRAKETVHMPIIGSLNGVSTGGWTEYARLIEEAGADALELNVYYVPTDPWITGADVEKMYVDVVREVSASITIPLAVKVGPYFSAMANIAHRLAEAGASGLVLFNRFYQPDLDLEKLEVKPDLTLSIPAEMRLPLRWVAILHGRVNVDFAITSGVHTPSDVIKGVMAGASVTMMASELLRHGVSRLARVRDGVAEWLEERGYDSIRQMQGSMSQRHVAEPAAFERANYMKVLQSWRPDPAGELRNLRQS